MSDSKHDVIPRADLSPAAPSIMHPLVEKMMAASPTAETLREILALQREWEKDQAKKSFDRALVELKRDLPAFLHREKKVDYLNVHFTHTSLAAAMQTVTPHLINHGFSLAWTPGSTPDGKVSVTCKLTHRDGHTEPATLIAPPDTSGNKSSPQAISSTVTLLQRTTALSLLGIATSDMAEPKGLDAERGSASTDTVDSTRNMRAMGALSKAGKTKEQAEAHVGRPIQAWTSSDLERLKAWVTPPAVDKKPSEMSEPPEDWQGDEPPPPEVEAADHTSPLAPEKPAGPFINLPQQSKMISAWRTAGKPDAYVKEHLAVNYGIEKTAEVPLRFYDVILTWCFNKEMNPSKA